MDNILAWAALLIALSVVSAVLIALYRRDLRLEVAYRKAVARRAETPAGPLEYAETGSGQPILVLHGAGGGCEQGLLLASVVDTRRCRVIAPSRPGYRGTPLSTGADHAAQADALAALLYGLGIERAVVLGISAGGLAAVQMALRHPTRCAGLILFSAVTPAILARPLPYWARPSVLPFRISSASGFLFWLSVRLSAGPMVWLLSAPSPARRDPPGRQILRDLFKQLHSVTTWRAGTLNDLQHVSDVGPQAVSKISVPTLILHGGADTLVSPDLARYAHEHVAGAKLVIIPGATHLAFGSHRRIAGEAIDAFVAGCVSST